MLGSNEIDATYFTYIAIIRYWEFRIDSSSHLGKTTEEDVGSRI